MHVTISLPCNYMDEYDRFFFLNRLSDIEKTNDMTITTNKMWYVDFKYDDSFKYDNARWYDGIPLECFLADPGSSPQTLSLTLASLMFVRTVNLQHLRPSSRALGC